jgi:hypothetical protein
MVDEIRTEWFEAQFPSQATYETQSSQDGTIECVKHTWSCENPESPGVHQIEVTELGSAVWNAVAGAGKQSEFLRTLIESKIDDLVARFSKRGMFRRKNRPIQDLTTQEGGTLRRTVVLKHEIEGVPVMVMALFANGAKGAIVGVISTFSDEVGGEISQQFMTTLRLPELTREETGLA